MKQRKIIFIIAAIILSVCLFACNDGKISAISVKEGYETVYLSPDGFFYAKNCVEVVGKGKLDYVVENSDVLKLDGEKIVAIKEGTGYVTVKSGDISCTITVVVSDVYRVSAEISGGEYTYDGRAHFPTVKGNLPEGTEVIYRKDGEIFEGAIAPGTYEIETEIILPEGYVAENGVFNSTIIIKKAFIDLSYIGFPSAIYEYDGAEKSLEITGELPEGVTCKITNGSAVNAGVYNATAEFFADDRYYEPIPSKSARLTINKREFKVDYSDFVTTSVAYDGLRHIPRIDAPEGLTVNYFVYEISSRTFLPAEDYLEKYERAFIDSGEYAMRAEFALSESLNDNYEVPADREISFTITKARFINDLKWTVNSYESGVGYQFVYDGNPVKVGLNLTEKNSLSLTGELPHGVNGEFLQGVTVRFVYKNSEKNEWLFTDAGEYSVTAKFTMPDGDCQKNYLPISDMPYTFVIDKADYPIRFLFDGEEISGGKDYSSPQVFDGKAHNFALKFLSQEEEEAFKRDIDISYYINGREAGGNGLFDAGNYRFEYRLKFKEVIGGNEASKNYYLPSDGWFDATILPLEFDMKGVRFVLSKDGVPLDDLVYDGNAHGLYVEGLPDGVAVNYKNNGVVDAGEYRVTAEFYAVGLSEKNYKLSGLNGEVKSISALLKIRKASYSSADIPEYRAEGGVYSREKTLSDYKIIGENQSAVRWYAADATPTCDVNNYTAVYNADPKNYNDYYFSLALIITPRELDASKIEIKEQFVKSGDNIAPSVIYDGKKSDLFTVSFRSEGEITGTGTYILTDVSAALTDRINYRIGDIPVVSAIAVYVYDGNVFEYDELNCVLRKYKGLSARVSVPAGTKIIYSRAFENSSVVNLLLPDSLTSLSENALNGMNMLEELSLPFLGTSRENYGALSSIFGADLPEGLTKVTVRDMTEIPAGAFRNANNISEIIFEKTVVTIGDYAFDGCENLTFADFSEVETIGVGAFRYCFKLQSLKLPFIGSSANDIKAINYILGDNIAGNSYRNYNLKTLDLSSGKFSSLAETAFKDLSCAERIILPDTLRAVPYGAFENVKAAVNLNDSFSSLTAGMFFGYKGENVSLPSTLKRIERSAFDGATELKEIVLPAGINYIGEYAFRNVKAEIKFTGSALTSLETRAFSYYKGRTLDLPSSVKNIGDYAFEYSGIVSAEIAADVILGEGIFSGSADLSSATVHGEGIPFRTFYGCSKLTKVTAPNIKEIENGAFANCVSLIDVSLPSSVERIGSGAFEGCVVLGIITLAAPTPPVFGENALPRTQALNLYVPANSVSAYKNALEESYINIRINARS